MKSFKLFIAALMLFALIPSATAHASGGFVGEKFVEVVHFEGPSGKGSASGSSYGNAKAIADGDVWAIPAGVMIEKVYVVIDTGLAGTTALDVGDDDDADGFVDGSLSIADLSVTGLYGWDAKLAGAYLRVQTAGATDAADIYVVPAAKFYSASGKEIKLDVTTTNTAGKFRVVIEGYNLGA